MGTGIALAFAAMVLAAVIVLFVALYVSYRGQRVVTCPETNRPVGTKIDAMLAARTWIGNRPRFVVTACSRWPDHGRCDQTCTRQIEARPEETLVRSAAGY